MQSASFELKSCEIARHRKNIDDIPTKHQKRIISVKGLTVYINWRELRWTPTEILMEIAKLLKMSKRNNSLLYLHPANTLHLVSFAHPEERECVCVCVKGVSESERKATVFYKTSNDFQFRALSSSGFLFMWTLKRKPMSAYVFICKEAYCVIVKRLQTKQKLSRKLCGKERERERQRNERALCEKKEVM